VPKYNCCEIAVNCESVLENIPNLAAKFEPLNGWVKLLKSDDARAAAMFALIDWLRFLGTVLNSADKLLNDMACDANLAR